MAPSLEAVLLLLALPLLLLVRLPMPLPLLAVAPWQAAVLLLLPVLPSLMPPRRRKGKGGSRQRPQTADTAQERQRGRRRGE